jgi:gluconate 2-dehydrogenase gamma chain
MWITEHDFMNDDRISRRVFITGLSAGISSAWLLSNLPDIRAAHDHAHRAAQSSTPVKFEFFSPAQAVEVEAVAAQIIPTDDAPGAREARVIYFIDRALTTFDRDKQKLYTSGLKQLQGKAKKLYPKTKKFSDLSPDQQIQVLKAIEKTEFFEAVRTHTITGFLANPEHGGNYDRVGWKLIGFEDQFVFAPPFGYYDGEYMEQQANGEGRAQ